MKRTDCIVYLLTQKNSISYCGLVDAKIRASDKDLPVHSEIKSPLLRFLYYLEKFSPSSWWLWIQGSMSRRMWEGG